MTTLKIDIITVGKLKERFWVDACAEYLKRLRPYAKMSVKEVDDISLTRAGTPERLLELEAAQIRTVLSRDAHVLVCDRQGSECSSEQIAKLIQTHLDQGTHHLVFVVGGSHGVSPGLIQQADESISFGPITLPHNLARVVLLEQLYRAFKIIHNEPYHK